MSTAAGVLFDGFLREERRRDPQYAQLALGDRLVSINGVALSAVSPDEAQAVLLRMRPLPKTLVLEPTVVLSCA